MSKILDMRQKRGDIWDKAKASDFFAALAEDRQIPADLLTG